MATTKSSLIGSRNFKQASILKHPKKLEGFDPSMLNASKSTQLPQQSKQYVSSQAIEQDYVNGLQDEVKLLEYEIKLLKEKETDEMDNFSHFFQFINDGAPINDNIIAIKNLYNLTQKELENKRKEMEDKVLNGERSIELLKRDIEELNAKYRELFGIFQQRNIDFDKEYIDVFRQQLEQKYLYDMKKPIKDTLIREAREAQAEILKFKRLEEKAKLEAPKIKNEQEAKEIRLKNQIKDVEDEILDLREKTELDLDGEKFRKEKIDLDIKNQIMEKEIISVSAKISQSKTIQQELEFQLKQLTKERLKDMQDKRQIHNNIVDLKNQIIFLQKQDEEQIDMLVREREKARIRELEIQSDALKDKCIIVAQERTQKYESINQQLVQDKMQNQLETNEFEYDKEKLEKELKEAEAELLRLKIENDILAYQNDEYSHIIEEDGRLTEKLTRSNNNNDKIIESLQEKISMYHRQLRLIQEIKNFDFEEIKMAAESNKQVNGSIHNLVSKWVEINNDQKNVDVFKQ